MTDQLGGAAGPDAPPPPIVVPPIMSPGTYLRLRREAAGLTKERVADLMAINGVFNAELKLLSLTAIEEGTDMVANAARDRFVFSLFTIMRLDGAVYMQLVDLEADPEAAAIGALPVPHICTGCGCSWHDACVDRDGQPCAWSAHDPNLCTHCEAKTAADAQ